VPPWLISIRAQLRIYGQHLVLHATRQRAALNSTSARTSTARGAGSNALKIAGNSPRRSHVSCRSLSTAAQSAVTPCGAGAAMGAAGGCERGMATACLAAGLRQPAQNRATLAALTSSRPPPSAVRHEARCALPSLSKNGLECKLSHDPRAEMSRGQTSAASCKCRPSVGLPTLTHSLDTV
jgi:hypothetical protein